MRKLLKIIGFTAGGSIAVAAIVFIASDEIP